MPIPKEYKAGHLERNGFGNKDGVIDQYQKWIVQEHVGVPLSEVGLRCPYGKGSDNGPATGRSMVSENWPSKNFHFLKTTRTAGIL